MNENQQQAPREAPVQERSSLLEQLRIDRGVEPAEVGGRRWPWWLGLVLLVVLAGAGGWMLLMPPAGVAVRVVVAEAAAPAAGGAAVGRASILDASGYVVARRQATVSSKITGKVVEVRIEEGQRVERDEVMARLDASNAQAALLQAQAQWEQSRAALEAARVAYENEVPIFRRHEEQYAREVISAQEYDAARASHDAARWNLEVASRAVEVAQAGVETARRSLEDTVVRAPFAGVVTVKAAQEGEMVSPVSAGGGFTRTGIGTIVDMESLEVEVDVSESFINRVREGQGVRIRLNAYPEWGIAGSVIAIVPTADRARATVKVRVRLAERDERVLPEMGVRVSFLSEGEEPDGGSATEVTSAVVVPVEAVQGSGETGVVYVLRGETVERRAVRLGERTQAGQTVLSGLAAGTRVAVGDFAALADGVRVRVEP